VLKAGFPELKDLKTEKEIVNGFSRDMLGMIKERKRTLERLDSYLELEEAFLETKEIEKYKDILSTEKELLSQLNLGNQKAVKIKSKFVSFMKSFYSEHKKTLEEQKKEGAETAMLRFGAALSTLLFVGSISLALIFSDTPVSQDELLTATAATGALTFFPIILAKITFSSMKIMTSLDNVKVLLSGEKREL